jgi:hypothetical protein
LEGRLPSLGKGATASLAVGGAGGIAGGKEGGAPWAGLAGASSLSRAVVAGTAAGDRDRDGGSVGGRDHEAGMSPASLLPRILGNVAAADQQRAEGPSASTLPPLGGVRSTVSSGANGLLQARTRVGARAPDSTAHDYDPDPHNSAGLSPVGGLPRS